MSADEHSKLRTPSEDDLGKKCSSCDSGDGHYSSLAGKFGHGHSHSHNHGHGHGHLTPAQKTGQAIHNVVLVISGFAHAVMITLLTRNPIYFSSFQNLFFSTNETTSALSNLTTASSLPAGTTLAANHSTPAFAWNSTVNPLYLEAKGWDMGPTTTGLLILSAVFAKNLGTLYNNCHYQEEWGEFFGELWKVMRGRKKIENPTNWLYLLLLLFISGVAGYSAWLVADEVSEVYFDKFNLSNDLAVWVLSRIGLMIPVLLTTSYVVVADTLGLTMNKIFGHDDDHEHTPPFFRKTPLAALNGYDLNELKAFARQYSGSKDEALSSACKKILALTGDSNDHKTVIFNDDETKALRDAFKNSHMKMVLKFFNWCKIVAVILLNVGAIGEFLSAQIRCDNGDWPDISRPIIWAFSPGIVFEMFDIARVVVGLKEGRKLCPDNLWMLPLHFIFLALLLGNHLIMLGAEGIVSSEEMDYREGSSLANDGIESVAEMIYHYFSVVLVLDTISAACCSRNKSRSRSSVSQAPGGKHRQRRRSKYSSALFNNGEVGTSFLDTTAATNSSRAAATTYAQRGSALSLDPAEVPSTPDADEWKSSSAVI